MSKPIWQQLKRTAYSITIALVILGMGLGFWFYWQHRSRLGLVLRRLLNCDSLGFSVQSFGH